MLLHLLVYYILFREVVQVEEKKVKLGLEVDNSKVEEGLIYENKIFEDFNDLEINKINNDIAICLYLIVR